MGVRAPLDDGELGASHSASFSFLHTRAVSVNALLCTGSKEEEIRATLVTPYYRPENYKLGVIVGESSATRKLSTKGFWEIIPFRLMFKNPLKLLLTH